MLLIKKALWLASIVPPSPSLASNIYKRAFRTSFFPFFFFFSLSLSLSIAFFPSMHHSQHTQRTQLAKLKIASRLLTLPSLLLGFAGVSFAFSPATRWIMENGEYRIEFIGTTRCRAYHRAGCSSLLGERKQSRIKNTTRLVNRFANFACVYLYKYNA